MRHASSALLVLLLACLAPGCAAAPEVSVQVLTDLAPVTQFDEIAILRDGVRSSFIVAGTQSYVMPRSVVEYTDVPAGTVLELTAELRLRGAVVLRRTRTTRITGRHIVLFTFTWSCTDTVCPMGDPRATECIGGRCVVPGCEGMDCVTPECAHDGECMPASSCEAPRCLEGLCFQFADPTRCTSEQICVPGAGCQTRLSDPDGGIPEVPDAWSPPPGVDAACMEGMQVPCTTRCGSVGVTECSAGLWGACAMPAEICDGMDQDCDGQIDNGLTCRSGTSESCTTSCGSTGMRTCTVACEWGACAPPTVEVCDGRDEDCDGLVDEGFRASVLRTSYPALAMLAAGCDGMPELHGLTCNSAYHRACQTGCTTSGFGPVETDGGAIAEAGCVIGEDLAVSFATLASHHAPCDGARERFGPNCSAAIHRFCISRGFVSGFGPVETALADATVTCVRAAELRATTYAELQTFWGLCDGSMQRWGQHCNAAIHRYCMAAGFVSGFGPVEIEGDMVAAICTRR